MVSGLGPYSPCHSCLTSYLTISWDPSIEDNSGYSLYLKIFKLIMSAEVPFAMLGNILKFQGLEYGHLWEAFILPTTARFYSVD